MKKMFVLILLVLALAAPVFAQGYDIRTMTPEVKAALEARKGRFAQLKAFKAEGAVGENRRGYVEALNGAADVRELVSAENADRKTVYQTIVQQNGLEEGALATVEEVFAGVQRTKAAAGEKLEDPSGGWVTK